MAIYKPSELRAFLDSLGARAKKSLSQNFLIDGNIVKKIVQLADLQPGDTVLEIGPGPGVLTEALLHRAKRVIAVEMDRLFADALQRLSGVEITCGDILKFDMASLPEGTKVVANIPYHITTPIIEQMVSSRRIHSATLMVQKELAERIVAKPATREFSSLALFVQYHAKAKLGFLVPASCFYPKPKVESAVIRLDFSGPKKFPEITDDKAFEESFRKAFQQRRKTLTASLKPLYPSESVLDALNAIKKPSTTRPEELLLEEWVALFCRLIDC